jgi:hypothetical protein
MEQSAQADGRPFFDNSAIEKTSRRPQSARSVYQRVKIAIEQDEAMVQDRLQFWTRFDADST